MFNAGTFMAPDGDLIAFSLPTIHAPTFLDDFFCLYICLALRAGEKSRETARYIRSIDQQIVNPKHCHCFATSVQILVEPRQPKGAIEYAI